MSQRRPCRPLPDEGRFLQAMGPTPLVPVRLDADAPADLVQAGVPQPERLHEGPHRPLHPGEGVAAGRAVPGGDAWSRRPAAAPASPWRWRARRWACASPAVMPEGVSERAGAHHPRLRRRRGAHAARPRASRGRSPRPSALARRERGLRPRQFANPDNAEAHRVRHGPRDRSTRSPAGVVARGGERRRHRRHDGRAVPGLPRGGLSGGARRWRGRSNLTGARRWSAAASARASRAWSRALDSSSPRGGPAGAGGRWTCRTRWRWRPRGRCIRHGLPGRAELRAELRGGGARPRGRLGAPRAGGDGVPRPHGALLHHRAVPAAPARVRGPRPHTRIFSRVSCIVSPRRPRARARRSAAGAGSRAPARRFRWRRTARRRSGGWSRTGAPARARPAEDVQAKGTSARQREAHQPGGQRQPEGDHGVDGVSESETGVIAEVTTTWLSIAQAVLHLRDGRQQEAVEVLHHAAAGRQEPAREALGARLADVLGLHPVRAAAHHHLDLVLLLRGAEQARRGGRRCAARPACSPGVECRRARGAHDAAHGGVALRVQQREAVGLGGGLDAGRRVHPDEAVLLARGVRRRRSASVAPGSPDQARHRAALAGRVEAPAVVAALELARRARAPATAARCGAGSGPPAPRAGRPPRGRARAACPAACARGACCPAHARCRG